MKSQYEGQNEVRNKEPKLDLESGNLTKIYPTLPFIKSVHHYMINFIIDVS